jgi:RNA polymerase sigma-70 factor (ECF subfamily)
MSSGEAGREDRIGLDFAIVEDPWGSSAGKESPEDLLRKCATLDDAQAWERFLRRFNPLIVATVARIMRRYGFDRAGLIDDLVQDVYLKFSMSRARVLREFEPRYPGAVFGYLAVISANVVHDHFKSKAGKYHEQSALPENLAVPDEMDWLLLIREIEDVLRNAPVSVRDRQIFWLYYRQGMSAREIGAISSLKLTTKGVETVIGRLNELVRKAFENGQRQLCRGIVS